MKSFLHFIIIVFCSIALSCCLNDSSTKNGDAELYKVSWENVYDWHEQRLDTLLCGLSQVYKEVRHYSDGSKKVFMKLLIVDPDLKTRNPYVRCVYLDAAEISKFDAFIDSCRSKPQKMNEMWEFQIKIDAIFSYEEYEESIVFWCNQGYTFDLLITPKRFKEVLTQVMEDEAFKGDD